jgi:hypothetical protein
VFAYEQINDRKREMQEETDKISKTGWLPWTFFPVILMAEPSIL